MDEKILVKQFGSDPGAAFLEVIRAAPTPVRAAEIKREIVGSGVRQADVDRLWKRLQPVLKLHPQIRMAANRYEWSSEMQPAQASLDVLAGNLLARLPGWLSQALVQNVSRALNGGPATTWADKEFEKARLVADLAVAVDSLRARGGSFDEVGALLAEEAQRKRLWPIGRPGEIEAFDPAMHEVEGVAPAAGTTVEVLRSGYIWRGGGEATVAAKAVVTA